MLNNNKKLDLKLGTDIAQLTLNNTEIKSDFKLCIICLGSWTTYASTKEYKWKINL